MPARKSHDQSTPCVLLWSLRFVCSHVLIISSCFYCYQATSMEGVGSSLQTDYTLRVRRVLWLYKLFCYLSRSIILPFWASISIGRCYRARRWTKFSNGSSLFDKPLDSGLSASTSDNYFLGQFYPQDKKQPLRITYWRFYNTPKSLTAPLSHWHTRLSTATFS